MSTLNSTDRDPTDSEEQGGAELDPRVGAVVAGKYRIERLLGRGGMGAVYQATHLAIGKRVALKFLERDVARDRDAALRFQREAEAASSVESAHIVQIFDSGTSDDGLPFLVMELLQGEDLRARLKREGRLELPDVVHIAAQVLRGLSRAHDAHIVHRDLKPDNIFLCSRDDDPMFVKIVDFGISKIVRGTPADTLTRRGTVLGTAFYMSPEQAQAFRDVDGRADLYSLGAILYEALAGRPPHTGNAYEAVLISICTNDAPDIRVHAPLVPAAVASVIAKALSRDRDLRFQTALDFYDALADAVPDLLAKSFRSSRRTADPSPAAAGSSERPPAPAEAAPTLLAEPGLLEGASATASGTAVHPEVLESGSERKRPGLVAGAVVLFALASAVVLSQRAASSQTNALPTQNAAPVNTASVVQRASPSAAIAATAVASAAARESVPDLALRVEPLGSAALDAGNGIAAKALGVRTTKIKRAPLGPESHTSRTQGAAGPGVASELELNTRGP